MSVKVPGYVRSYLGQRTQRESFHGSFSDVWLLLSGIPQVSVHGPLVPQCIPVLLDYCAVNRS